MCEFVELNMKSTFCESGKYEIYVPVVILKAKAKGQT